MPRTRRALAVDTLESRDVPAALADGFETATAAFAPNGWQQWASNGSQYYQVTRSTAAEGSQSVAIYGNTNVTSRLWKSDVFDSDVRLSLTVQSNTPAPIILFGRGQNLNTANASHLAAVIQPGGRIALQQTTNGTTQTLASLTSAAPLPTVWLRITAEFVGTQAKVKIQRLDTQQFLAANGQWESTDAIAITQSTTLAGGGQVGFGRLAGPYGTAFADDFRAESLTPTGESLRKFEHIRIAQLAYSGQNVGSVDQYLFRETVDLVVAHPSFLNTLENASAETSKTIYSNLSNIYENLLIDWLDYADRTGANRESAFYHVALPTAFSGGSPSSRPVTWFWNATKYSLAGGPLTNVTSNARGTQSTGVVFGLTNEALALGQLEKFGEINISLSRVAGSGFNGVWEYASAVDTGGRVIQWQTLPINSNTTNQLTQSGRITFDPPTNWVNARLNASGDKFYYVRFRTTAATTTNVPIASRVHGRDYVNANGTNAGIIPAFDDRADVNGDGYLTTAEYANRRSGYDARFQYESRLFYPYYGQMRFVVNPGPAAVHGWAAEFHQKQLAANPNADGLFLDNANGKLPFAGTPVIESVTNYSTDAAALVSTVKSAINNRTVIVNTSGGVTHPAAAGMTAAAGIAFEEFLLRPTTVNWSGFLDVAAVLNRRLAASPDAKVILDSHPGNTSMLDANTRMGVLSYYYLLADPNRTYLMFFGGFSPASSWVNRWAPAAAVNVGAPLAGFGTFAEGNDPQNSNLQYRIYYRDYENAVVLFKPLSYKLGRGTGTTDAATATTHNLHNNYRQLHADGSLGPVISSITLKNGEGAVLMRA